MKETEKALKVLIKIMNKTAAAYADKKFTTAELFGLALTATGVVGIVKGFAGIEAEFKEFDMARDIPGLRDVILANIDIPDKAAEAKIKDMVMVVASFLSDKE